MKSDPHEKSICYTCVGEKYLSEEIARNGKLIHCSYCEKRKIKGLNLEKFSEHIDNAFQHHYERMAEGHPEDWPLEWLKEIPFEQEGTRIDFAITDAADVSPSIAEDIQYILADKYASCSLYEFGETTEYHNESYYQRNLASDEEWQLKWQNFEKLVKTRSRFFSKEVSEHLKSVFNDIELLEVDSKYPVVRHIGPKQKVKFLYRGRVFQSEDALFNALQHPDKDLGPPPSIFATAGRMNAAGISVFYGATEEETALAEIRPPVGSKVALAKFNILRRLKVLDLTALDYLLPQEGSVFDPKYASFLSKNMFLRKLSKILTRPIMPSDETFDYLPTQIIADFLSSELSFDGIIFRPAQSGKGLNVVIFNHASKIELLKHEPATDSSTFILNADEEDINSAYSIFLKPSALPPDNEEKLDLARILTKPIGPKDRRKATLSIDISSIKVAHIKSVKIIHQTHSIDFINAKDFEDDPDWIRT